MSEMGKRLKVLRKASGLSIKAVAQEIGVAESTYRDWENGRAIQGEPYVRIAHLFGVTLNTLFGLEDKAIAIPYIERELQGLAQHLGNIQKHLVESSR